MLMGATAKGPTKGVTASVAKSLVIVESPAKAKTINKFLGKNFVVKASMGHVRDLRSSPWRGCRARFHAEVRGRPGPGEGPEGAQEDGEGSSASTWRPTRTRGRSHLLALAHELKSARKPIHRVLFHEITKHAIQDAFTRPGRSTAKRWTRSRRGASWTAWWVQDQPLLWEKVRRGISAGRVQSVALRLVVEREREVRAFVPAEYWSITARLARTDGVPPEFRRSSSG